MDGLVQNYKKLTSVDKTSGTGNFSLKLEHVIMMFIFIESTTYIFEKFK